MSSLAHGTRAAGDGSIRAHLLVDGGPVGSSLATTAAFASEGPTFEPTNLICDLSLNRKSVSKAVQPVSFRLSG